MYITQGLFGTEKLKIQEYKKTQEYDEDEMIKQRI